MSLRLTAILLLSVASGSSAPAAFTWSEPSQQFGRLESTASSVATAQADLSGFAWTAAASQPQASERFAVLAESVDVLTQLRAGDASNAPVAAAHAERTELLALVTDASAESSRLVMLPSGSSATLTQPVGVPR